MPSFNRDDDGGLGDGAPALSKQAMAIIRWLPQGGGREFQIRYDAEQNPVVWVAVARFDARDPDSGRKAKGWKVGAALQPEDAVLDLAEKAMDGGKCVHCGGVTAYETNFASPIDWPPGFCAYSWDPELDLIRRGCQGTTPKRQVRP